MMGQFVVRNLFHRPMRTLIGVMAVAVEVALVVLIVGLTSGLLQETAKRIEGIGADAMLQSPFGADLPDFQRFPHADQNCGQTARDEVYEGGDAGAAAIQFRWRRGNNLGN